eukprot:GHVT01090301.1.p1 GENE.GHVT01090301.1~~GHVT01090301.1.p1  ORF type:complete len:182 (-),score=13.16 GHVT01090301.1:471-1016(-)
MKLHNSRKAPARSVLADVDFDSLGEALSFLDSDEQLKTALASKMCLFATRELWEISSSLVLSFGCQSSDLEKCAQEVRADLARLQLLGMRFEKLKKVSLEGYCASKGFASISKLCAQSLVQLHFQEYEDYDMTAVEGEFGKLQKLTLAARGVAGCFSSMSASCAGSLLELNLVDYDDFAYR